jgi:hypothetical protein
MFLADGGKTIRKSLETSGEPWQPQMKAFPGAAELDVYDMWQVQRERTNFCKIYMDRWNACEGLDAILSEIPSGPTGVSSSIADLCPRPNDSLHFCETWGLAACWVGFKHCFSFWNYC